MRIVTVYLGDSIPSYFWLHVRHILKIQKDYEVDIVTSNKIIVEPVCDPRVNYFVYSPQQEVSEKLDSIDMDTDFRNGFWRYSIERLFALTQHHLNFPSQSILHIESDVLPLRNFPFPKFENLENLAWSQVDSERDVAAIIFSPSADSSKWLSKKILEIIESDKDTDDMKALSEISRQYYEFIDILPSLPQPSSKLRNQNLNLSDEVLTTISSNFSVFGGIFDPAEIGIWLTGTEPRNYYGITKKFDKKSNIFSKSYIEPGNVNYSFKLDGGLAFSSEEASTAIYTLHIHSKNLNYFSEKFETYLDQDVRRSDLGRIERQFSFRILLMLLDQNRKKGTLLRFLSWLPGISRLKGVRANRKPI